MDSGFVLLCLALAGTDCQDFLSQPLMTCLVDSGDGRAIKLGCGSEPHAVVTIFRGIPIAWKGLDPYPLSL